MAETSRTGGWRRLAVFVRWRVRGLYFRHRIVRELGLLVRRLRSPSEVPDVAHALLRHEVPDGPVQRDEALMLHGLLRVTRPRTVVEVGFLRGESSLNFLLALDDDARLFAFDIDPQCEAIARDLFGHDPRFTFRRLAQEHITPEAVEGRPIDFLFLDAAHDLALNQQTFLNISSILSDDALIAIHDTGTIHRSQLPPEHRALGRTERWAGNEFEGQPGERAFVNWLLEHNPELAQVHLHTHRVVRCGITLIQRTRRLARPGEPRVLARVEAAP